MNATRAALGAALVLAVALAFEGARANAFLAFDDDIYVTGNPMVAGGLRAEAIAQAFTSFRAGNWHPLTWLSHMLDVELFGLEPGPHHAVNVALHAANALFVFAALAALTGATWRAALVAALFALHPLRVESVAWVAERKDLLCALFGLLALLAWLRFARGGSRAGFAAAHAAYAAALAAKPMLVTFPFLLLLLDFWPLGRWPGRVAARRLLREKLGLFALAFGSCLVTLAAQTPNITDVPIQLRVANALIAFPAYLARTFWPTQLAALYPYRGDVPALEIAGAALLVAAATALALRHARRAPWFAVGWLWFAGMLVPTLGLVQVGKQAFADRYTYLPGIGLAVAVVFGVERLTAGSRAARAAAGTVAVAALVACVALTRAQLGVWRDTETLFAHAVAVTRGNWFAHGELGIARSARGDWNGASAELQRALALRPNYERALAHLGIVRVRQGAVEEGIALQRRALALDPQLVRAHYALALSFERAGRLDEAVREYRAELARGPAPDVALKLARLLAIAPDPALRDGPEAVRLAEAGCPPASCALAEHLDVLAMAYMEAGRQADALRAVDRALALAYERGAAALAAKIEAHRRLYLRGEPLRVPARARAPGDG